MSGPITSGPSRRSPIAPSNRRRSGLAPLDPSLPEAADQDMTCRGFGSLRCWRSSGSSPQDRLRSLIGGSVRLIEPRSIWMRQAALPIISLRSGLPPGRVRDPLNSRHNSLAPKPLWLHQPRPSSPCGPGDYGRCAIALGHTTNKSPRRTSMCTAFGLTRTDGLPLDLCSPASRLSFLLRASVRRHEWR
jgi:hypothetical protein